MRTLEGWRARLAIGAGLLAILAATNRWEGWTAGWVLVQGHDEPIYKTIALAAPHLPPHVPNQHAQEFPLVYLVGLAAHILGVNVDYVFRSVCYGVIIGICFALYALLKQARVGLGVYTVCMGVFILNTYTLRYYLIVPGYFLDVTFVLALAGALYAVISGRYWLAVAALVLAVLARQTALPTSLAFAWWVSFGAGWRDASTRTRLLRGVGIIAIPAAVFLALVKLSAPFSIPATPGIVGLTIIGDLEHLASQFGALVEHVVRVANGLFAVASLTTVAVLQRLKQQIRRKLPPEFVGCSVVGWSIVLQALLLNTNYSGHPERLTVLSVIPFTVAAAYLLRDLEQVTGFVLPLRTAAIIVVVLAVGSLQYLFTTIGPSTAAQGVVLQFVAAVVLGVLLWGAADGRGLSLGLSPRARGSS